MPKIFNINTVEYWDSIYGGGKFPTLAGNNQQRYLAAARLQVGKSALELACGQGGLARALAELYGETVSYLGTDFSKSAIATSVYPAAAYRCMDWRDVNTLADTVYAMDVIEHLEEPEKLVDRMARLALKRFVISTPKYGEIDFKLHRGEHLWDFTEEELIALLSPYGTVGEFLPCGLQCLVVAVDV